MFLSVTENTFTELVLHSSTPVLVHFWAPWCGLCKMIVPQLSQFVNESQGHIKLIGINADQNLKLASAYRLKTLPTLILFDQGKILQRLEHFQGREDLGRTLMSFSQLVNVSVLPKEVHKIK